MLSSLQLTDQGSSAQWGLGEISAAAQQGFKQGPQFPILHRRSTLMVLPASRETKAGLGRGQGTPRHPGPRAMGSNVVGQNTGQDLL